MYEAGAAFAAYLEEDSRTFLARLTLNGNPISGEIMEITIYGGSNGEDDFTLGSAVSQYIEVEVTGAAEKLENKELLLEIGAEVEGTMVWIPMGLFTACRPVGDEESNSFTAFDRMIKTEKVFDPSGLGETTDTVAVLQKVATICSVPVKTSGLSAISMATPSGYTCREVLSYVSQMYGGFAVCNRSGEIEIRRYADSGLQVLPSRYWDTFEHNDFAYRVSILSCITGVDEDGENVVITAGSGTGRVITFSNPFMTQAALNNAASMLGDFQYMPGNVTMLGDPRLDPWDCVSVTDLNGVSYRVPCMSLVLEYDGGLSTQIEAFGKTEEEQEINFSGPRTKNMDRYYASLVMINNALVGKLDAEVARIQYAQISSLQAAEAHIDELEADYGSFKTATVDNLQAVSGDIQRLRTEDISAINAAIDNINAINANITSILSGNIGTGQLQTITLTAQNVTVQKSFADRIIATYALIQDLVAGNIDTDEVTISSSDGGMVITGNTQQFKDANGQTRIQIGKDALGNYSFGIYDSSGNALWYNDGITAEGIPDGTLVDDMVAAAGGSYSGISANKLNISQVKGAIEEGGFSSSLIYFDDSHQTLNQVYTRITSDIEDVEDLATQAKSSADSTASQLSSIREMISGIDTLEGMMLMLTNEAHVVHTYNDGTGGDYGAANTRVVVMVGETDVTGYAVLSYEESSSISGVWNNVTKTYQVTGLSDMNGYVDFSAVYGAVVRFLTTRAGNQFVTRSGKKLKLPSGAAHLSKRFSISKAPDGQVGTSYALVASTLAMTRNSENTLAPETVTFSAIQNNVVSTVNYMGYYKIEETEDWATYTVKYTSSAAELSKQYTPSSSSIKGIRCTLMDAAGQMLDVQTVTVIADADGLQIEVGNVRNGVQQLTNRMGTVESGIEGLQVSLSQTDRTLAGVTNGTLLFQTHFTWSNNGQRADFHAVVYKAGEDVTADYPSRWFNWFRRTETGEERIEIGKLCQVNKSTLGYGGTIIGRFTTYQTKYLLSRGGNVLTTRAGNKITVFVQ